MPRFYFEIKNILHSILSNVYVRVREKKIERPMKERKAELNFRNHAVKSFFFLLYLVIYLSIFVYACSVIFH